MDPMSGTGTTARVAQTLGRNTLGRNYVAIEEQEPFVSVINERLERHIQQQIFCVIAHSRNTSKFSIEQIITTLSSRSRMTSISNSFQPMIDSSINTSVTGDWSNPLRTKASNSPRLGQGRDVGSIRRVGIGHDGGGIGVDEHDLVAPFAKRLTGLSAGIIEFASLANDNGPRTDQEYLANVVATGHFSVRLQLRIEWRAQDPPGEYDQGH